jgi:hypothetical protein
LRWARPPPAGASIPAADPPSAFEKRALVVFAVGIIIQACGADRCVATPQDVVTEKGTAAVLTVRPRVAELVFQLYGRALHPELFEVCQTRSVRRGDYEAKIDITSAGHVVTWRYGGLTLTEVAASAHHPLPEKRRLLRYSLRGQRSDSVECRGKVRYEMSFQLEPVDPEVFWTFQHELAQDGVRQGMLHKFNASGRMALGAMSYIHIETRARKLLVQAFHTFPDDYAIVKSQSIFRLP